MKAAPLLIAWHDENAPIYSAHFEPSGKGRLATGGGDHHIRLWRLEANGEERKVTYLATLIKHTQAVNVVRWCPRGELLASAGDDGNVLLWTPSDTATQAYGEETADDLESWRVKTMVRSASGSEIYDLAWSPDGAFFITGSMDNIARIYSASNGQIIRQIAEHNHYVQGVAWDPLNEYVATQSSDRSVHIYTLKTKDGQFSLAQHNKVTKMDMPPRRISSNSPAPPDFGAAPSHRAAFLSESTSFTVGSPVLSAPGTPQSLALPMPPPTSHSRRSSFSSQIAASIRRSVSPSPSSMPLPAVMPAASPSLSTGMGMTTTSRATQLYANETFTSFFRRLTFTPDGSLLFTPAGQYKLPSQTQDRRDEEVINTVYIYTRGGLNKPPVAHLPGHKKPSIAVKCSPLYYELRSVISETVNITIDTGNEEDIVPLPEPAVPQRASMAPPINAPSPSPVSTTMPSPRNFDIDAPSGPTPTFSLPYRIVYGVATQDAVYVYDTQQTKPICVVSNLHYATFTDLCWSNDGLTLFMTSSDGFCSTLTFAQGELGTVYTPPSRPTPAPISIAKANSATSTPQATPTMASPRPIPAIPRQASGQSTTGAIYPPPSPFAATNRPASPARSMSASSIATQSSFAIPPDQNAPPSMNNPTPHVSSLPSVAASGSAAPNVPLFTPPQTPGVSISVSSAYLPQQVAGVKRLSNASELSDGDAVRDKRRRIAPTPVASSELPPPPVPEK